VFCGIRLFPLQPFFGNLPVTDVDGVNFNSTILLYLEVQHSELQARYTPFIFITILDLTECFRLKQTGLIC